MNVAFYSVENISEVVDHLNNITVYVIDQYLSRMSINGPNTIMRKGRLAVVFLDSVFPSKNTETAFSGKVSPKHLYTYLNCSYLTYSISNNTHYLLFLPHLVTELKITTNQRFRPK